MPKAQRVLSLQKKIYKSLKQELSLVEKNKTRELLRYEMSYKRQFRGKFRLVERSDLVRHCLHSNFIFFGDYHPFYQSQKTALRLLEQLEKQYGEMIIGLECVFAEFQSALDHFLERDITLGELRETIDYDARWPFAWENYKEIFSFALEHKIRLLALNVKPQSGRSSLKQRDLAAAEIIFKNQSSTENPNRTYFIFYGDLHLAKNHLPKKIETRFRGRNLPYRATHVYQNETSLYWKIAGSKNRFNREVFQIDKNSFCIMNSAPWVKLQSYLDWLEGSSPAEDDDFSTDLSSKILSYAEHIRDFLQIRVAIDADYTINTAENTQTLRKLARKKITSGSTRNFILHALEMRRPLLLGEEKLLYVPNPSLNILGELASLALFYSIYPKAALDLDPRRNLNSTILHFMRAYFGSKLLNPKRKCNELIDLKQAPRPNLPRSVQIFRRSTFKLAVQKTNSLLGKSKRPFRHSHLNKYNFNIVLESARCIGFLLAERLFYSVDRGYCEMHEVKFLFETSPSNEEEADIVLKKVVRDFIGKSRSFRSKKERF